MTPSEAPSALQASECNRCVRHRDGRQEGLQKRGRADGTAGIARRGGPGVPGPQMFECLCCCFGKRRRFRHETCFSSLSERPKGGSNILHATRGGGAAFASPPLSLMVTSRAHGCGAQDENRHGVRVACTRVKAVGSGNTAMRHMKPDKGGETGSGCDAQGAGSGGCHWRSSG